MKLANPVRTLRLRSVLAFVYNWGLEIALVASVLWLCFGFSIDKDQEAHGFILSGDIVTGNGILVRDTVNGKDRIMFLTCRHVVTAVMLATRRAFVDCPSEDNAIYIREHGKGFCYVKLANIDPRRWLTIDDASQDFAWIELTEDEIKAVSPSGKKLHCIDLRKMVKPLNRASWREFAKGDEVCSTSIFAPVFGSGAPETKSYYWPHIPLGFLNRNVSIAHDWTAKVLFINKDIKVPLEGREGHGEVVRPQMVIDEKIHVNISGSPVFGLFDENGRKERKLIGIVDVGSSNDKSGFQTLDKVLIPLTNNNDPGCITLLSYLDKQYQR